MMKAKGVLPFKEEEDLNEDVDLAYELGFELYDNPKYFWDVHHEI